jgi:hypothetical protein
MIGNQIIALSNPLKPTHLSNSLLNNQQQVLSFAEAFAYLGISAYALD